MGDNNMDFSMGKPCFVLRCHVAHSFPKALLLYLSARVSRAANDTEDSLGTIPFSACIRRRI